MKRTFLKLFMVALINCAIVQAFSQHVFEKYKSKEALTYQATILIDEYDSFMKKNGIIPPFIPGVEITTTYALIY